MASFTVCVSVVAGLLANCEVASVTADGNELPEGSLPARRSLRDQHPDILFTRLLPAGADRIERLRRRLIRRSLPKDSPDIWGSVSPWLILLEMMLLEVKASR